MASRNFDPKGTTTSSYKESGADVTTAEASSRSTEEILNPDELSDHELLAAVEALRKKTRAMRLENEMMVRYLVRNAQFDENNLREQLDKLSERMIELEMGRTRTRPSLDPGRLSRMRAASSSESSSMASGDDPLSVQREMKRKLMDSVAPKTSKGEGAIKEQSDKKIEEISEEQEKEAAAAQGEEAAPAQQPEAPPGGDKGAEAEDSAGKAEAAAAGAGAEQGAAPEPPKEADAAAEGAPAGAPAGAPEGAPAGAPEGAPEGASEGAPEGAKEAPAAAPEAAAGERRASARTSVGAGAGGGAGGEAAGTGPGPRRTSGSPTIRASLGGMPSIASERRTSVASLIATPSGFLAFEKRGPRLNVPGKAEMLTRELRDGRKDLDEFVAQSERKKLKLSELLEAASATADELSAHADAFEREVSVGGVDPVTGRIPAERFVRHVAEWIRATTQLGDKLRLRSTTLRVNIRKVKVQLKAKQELGESLTPVDFEQLRIDNERFLSTIEQKNLQVIELKRMAGDCALQLSVHKKALLSDRSIEDYLRTLGDERRKQCDMMEEESRVVQEQNQRLQNRLDSLRTLTENFVAPPVLDYARLCARVAEQERERRMWRRRVNLQETALRVACSNLRTSRVRQRSQGTAPPNALQAAHRAAEQDDPNSEGFQRFWFGGVGEGKKKKRKKAEGGGGGDGDGDGDVGVALDEDDSWTDMPDTFLTESGSPNAARPVLRPCTPPSPPTPAPAPAPAPAPDARGRRRAPAK